MRWAPARACPTRTRPRKRSEWRALAKRPTPGRSARCRTGCCRLADPVPLSTGAGSSSAGAGSTAGEATDDDVPWSSSVQPSSTSGAAGAAADRLKLDESRGVPMVSAGSAGTSGATASFSSTAEPPPAKTSLAAAAARATFARAARTADVDMIWVSSSVLAVRSSSSCCTVTTVGEAPPEPSDVFVRLSKPSSYDLTLMRLSLDRTPKGHSCQEDGFLPRLRDNMTLIRTLETRQSLPSA